jgi:hypothetical protein
MTNQELCDLLKNNGAVPAWDPGNGALCAFSFTPTTWRNFTAEYKKLTKKNIKFIFMQTPDGKPYAQFMDYNYELTP